MKDRLWVKLWFLRGAGPRGPPGGGAVSRADSAHLEKVSLPALLALELRPHPAAPPRLPKAQQPGPGARSRPSRQRPWRALLPHPAPPALSVLLVRSMASASWRSKVSGGQARRGGVRPAGERRAWVGGRGAGCGSGP